MALSIHYRYGHGITIAVIGRVHVDHVVELFKSLVDSLRSFASTLQVVHGVHVFV